MLSLFAFLSLLNGIAIILLGEYIVLKDSGNPLNRVFAAFCAVTGAWGFVEFMYRQSATISVADFWIHIYAFIWPFSSAVALHFTLIFAKKTDWLKQKFTYVAIYLPAAVIAITDFSTDLITAGPVRVPWGYATGTPADQLYYWIASLWVVVVGVFAVVLVLRFRSEAIDRKEKKQAMLIVIGFSLPLIAGAISQVVIPAAGIVFPELTTTFLVALVGFVVLAISRYGLFVVSPESAAQTIISTMSDALIIIGPKGNLLSVNNALLDMLGYSESDLLGRYAGVLWAEEENIRPLLDRLLKEGFSLRNHESRYRKKNGEIIDVLFSTSIVWDQGGALAGVIGIATDVTELKKAEEARGIADYLQEVLLKLPKRIPGIDFRHLYRSATEEALVGGDFLDLFEIGDRQVGIVVGDVSGKGLEASALTSLIKDTIKAYSYLGQSPAFIISKTNGIVVKASDSNTFVTVFFGILNTGTGVLVYCNAGHQPGIIKSDMRIKMLEPTSPVIGALERMDYLESRVLMTTGDILVLYTDGVTEARHKGELFGEKRLVGLIRSKGIKNVRQVPELVFKEIENYTKGKLSDDVVVLAVGPR